MRIHGGFEFESSPALKALQVFVESSAHRTLSSPGEWESFERELNEKSAAVQAEILAARLQQEDVDEPHVMIHDVRHRRVCRSRARYQSASGPVEVERTLYRPCRSGSAKAVCALELQVGIVAGEYTPLAARQMAIAVAATTSREAEGLFRAMGVFRPSRSNLDRLPKVLSAAWEAHRVTWERELNATKTVPAEANAVAVELDGVLIPSREAAHSSAGRRSGPVNYREVGCGAVALYDGDGERLQTVRYGRAPEANKATLKEQLMDGVGSILLARPDLHLVLLSDGAEDHWTFLEELAEWWEQPGKVTLLVDYWHACGHLKRALDLRYGESSVRGRARFEKLKVVLKEDPQGVQKVIRSLVALRESVPRSRRDDLEKEIGYFRNQRTRMGYAEAMRCNLPIGSGVIEAACKTLVSQRLKRSGMRWTHAGAQAILTLRALHQSDGGRWERGWRLISSHYHATVRPLTPRRVA